MLIAEEEKAAGYKPGEAAVRPDPGRLELPRLGGRVDGVELQGVEL